MTDIFAKPRAPAPEWIDQTMLARLWRAVLTARQAETDHLHNPKPGAHDLHDLLLADLRYDAEQALFGHLRDVHGLTRKEVEAVLL